MKLKDLKTGQQFKFAKITDKTKYVIIAQFPQLIYKSINGYIEYKPTYASRLNKEVALLNIVLMPVEIRFTDPDGDQTIVSTETEADFVHVMVKTVKGIQIAALNRDDASSLVEFLLHYLEIKH